MRGLFQYFWEMDTRPLEAFFALAIIIRGVTLLLPGDEMTQVYAAHLTVMSEAAWGTLTLGAGLFIFAGLVINGRWHRSPWLRFTGAIVGASVYTMLTATFAIRPNPGALLAAGAYLPHVLTGLWVTINISAKA